MSGRPVRTRRTVPGHDGFGRDLLLLQGPTGKARAGALWAVRRDLPCRDLAPGSLGPFALPLRNPSDIEHPGQGRRGRRAVALHVAPDAQPGRAAGRAVRSAKPAAPARDCRRKYSKNASASTAWRARRPRRALPHEPTSSPGSPHHDHQHQRGGCDRGGVHRQGRGVWR